MKKIIITSTVFLVYSSILAQHGRMYDSYMTDIDSEPINWNAIIPIIVIIYIFYNLFNNYKND